MTAVPGTINLGRFRAAYEEKRARSDDDAEYVLLQRAVIRLNDELARLDSVEDFEVSCDHAQYKTATGHNPSALQFIVASMGFCMFSKMAWFAAKLKVPVDDAELDLCMAYDLSVRQRIGDFASATKSLTYQIRIKSTESHEKIMHLAQLAGRGCHTVTSLRKRVPVSGKLLLNNREFEISD